MAKVYIRVDIVADLDDSYIPDLLEKPDESLKAYKARKDLILDILHETEKPHPIIAKAVIADVLVENY